MPFKLFKDIEYTVYCFRVRDGDTIWVQVEEEYSPRQWHEIRLHRIDAPESDHHMYSKSKRKLKSLCKKAKSLTVVIKGKDKYDRKLGIRYGQYHRKRDINAMIVQDGYAYAHPYNGNDPYREQDDFAKIEGNIIRQELDKGPRPWDSRKTK